MMRILWIRNPNTALKTPFLPKHRAKNCLRQKSLRILYCSLIHCIGTPSTVSSANDKKFDQHFTIISDFAKYLREMTFFAVHKVTCYEQLSTMLHGMDSCPQCCMVWTAVHKTHVIDSCPQCYMLWTLDSPSHDFSI